MRMEHDRKRVRVAQQQEVMSFPRFGSVLVAIDARPFQSRLKESVFYLSMLRIADTCRRWPTSVARYLAAKRPCHPPSGLSQAISGQSN